MIPTPIRQVLFTIQKHQVQALLMGGQACVLYGAAQFSRDVDLALLASPDNFVRLSAALDELNAKRIAVPPFDPDLLAQGHAVHFRCQGGAVDGLRIDVMTRLRGVAEFHELWARRTTIADADGIRFEVMSLEDLVQAKKTQRDKDWPMIEALVESHYHALHGQPTPERVRFWLLESRSPERLVQLVKQFQVECDGLVSTRPLLGIARRGRLDELRAALDAEAREVKSVDRAYWEPLKQALAGFRRAERDS